MRERLEDALGGKVLEIVEHAPRAPIFTLARRERCPAMAGRVRINRPSAKAGLT
ncbi:MAG: hypothetical protein ACREFZ_06330 [Acetobacteraceae bacterium]